MKQNEICQYEFELLSHTDVMVAMIQNRLVVTTDTSADLEQVYTALDESVQTGVFYCRNTGDKKQCVYFSELHDRTRFIDAISAL